MISNNLFLDSPTTGAVSNGNRARLFAPNSWQAGSSAVHLDEATYNDTIDALMTPSFGFREVVRQPGAITFRLFQDMGWRTNVEGWIYGTSGTDTLTGTNIGQNLFGLEGADSLFGRGGNDALYGCAGSDSLFGENGDDILFGGSEDDELDGGVGNDEMFGEAGNDTYYVDSINDRVVELNFDDTNPGGIDIVYSSVSYSLDRNLENLNLLESGGTINGTGNEQNNIITGNNADNVLDGRAGSDTLIGGAGKDTLIGGEGFDSLDGGIGDDSMRGGAGGDRYYVDSVGDTITEVFDEGIDAVESSITYTLDDNLENLTLIGSDAINGTGNSLSNFIVGNSNANYLYGGGDIDYLYGGGGSDLLDGEVGNDYLYGGLGDDRYYVDSINQ